VAKAKKAILQKKRTIGPDSTQPTVSRQSIGVSKVSARIPAAPLPDFVEPMKALLVDSIRPGDWVYEIKFDGYRALALRGGRETRILSRNQKDLGKKFAEITSSIAALEVQDAIIDGRIVALTKGAARPFSYSKDHMSKALQRNPPPACFCWQYSFPTLRLSS
jgi:bifunctional non-homologous end joining protein LigD